ncbi:MAG TPA: hypothetical protein VK987_06750 [Anaerolineae bacterium]|jgi:hypothetical protein|nr:hypothetical protein [Anaerolineae bacterium]
MSIYADYTADEQQQLRAGLQAAAVAVSAASPGRPEETVSEGFAAARVILESGPDYVANTLVTSMIREVERRLKTEQPFPDYVEVATADGAHEAAIAALHAVSELLDRKASPGEAAGYKEWLLRVARATAEAGMEDQGFLGRGGVQINAAEQGALREIEIALGVRSSPASP